MKIRMELGPDSYDILIERGCLARAGKEPHFIRHFVILA